MKMLYSSCPPEMRDTLLHHTQETAKELTELSEKFKTKRTSERIVKFHSLAQFVSNFSDNSVSSFTVSWV